MTTRTTISAAAALATALALAACPGYDQEDRPVADIPVVELGPTGTGQDTVGALPAPERVAVQGAGIAADAVISPMESSTHVVLQVREAAPNTTVRGAIHSGTCAAPGGEVASLGSVQTDAAGTGRGEAHLDLPAHQVMNGGHHIQLHGGSPDAAGASAAAGGTAGACADIPARAVGGLEGHTAPAAGQPGGDTPPAGTTRP